MPAFLLPLRSRLAHIAGLTVEAFEQALVSEYSPGTPIGWHVDQIDFLKRKLWP
jgi:alkylated DNA repair dioxygenase AlkB